MIKTAYKLSVLCALLALTAAPLSASANTVLRTGESVDVAADQEVEGNFYAVGGDVIVSGTVTKDIYAAAGTFTSNGTIGADLFVLAGSVELHASVADDVRIVSGESTIAGHVEGDVVMLGGMLTVLSSAQIDGDLMFFGGEAEINGPVGGDILGSYSSLRIDAPVGGTVDVSASSFTVGERAVIDGDVTYESPSELTQAEGATIAGELKHERTAAISQDTFRESLRTALVPFLMSLVAAIALYLVFGRQLGQFLHQVRRGSGLTLLIGLAAFLATPFVVVIIATTIIGLMASAILLLAYLLALLLAYVVSQILLGALIFSALKRPTVISPLSVVTGVAAFHVLLLIPFVAPVVILGGVSLGLGVMVMLLYYRLR